MQPTDAPFVVFCWLRGGYGVRGSIEVDPKSLGDVPKFLNRMLCLQLHDQELLFNYFASTLDATIKQVGQPIHSLYLWQLLFQLVLRPCLLH